jgi:hypothetical protein
MSKETLEKKSLHQPIIQKVVKFRFRRTSLQNHPSKARPGSKHPMAYSAEAPSKYSQLAGIFSLSDPYVVGEDV